MRKTAFLLALTIASACGGSKEDPQSPQLMSRQPVSVRGWVEDVAGAKRAETIELELFRRQALFQQTSVWVEKTQFASGGVSENGAFLVLDVPPGTSTIGFSAPGAENAKIVLENIPGNADVMIPELLISNTSTTVRDPAKLRVRIPGKRPEPFTTTATATIAGHKVPIVEVPMAQLTDRRQYPQPPGFRPVATFK